MPDSLISDLFRTAGSTILTAGSHAMKGLSLGLLDPTEEVAEWLGDDIYGAAPGWAKTGSEIAGSIVPVSGALKLARFAIPGVSTIPRMLQGFAAGAGLGGLGGLIEGQSPEEILKNSLLEGTIFGGIEGLSMIPGMIKKRKLKDVQRLWSGVRTGQLDDWAKVTSEDLAAGEIADPTLEQIAKLGKETKKLPEGIMLTQDFIDEPNLLGYFKLMDETMTVQTRTRLIPGKIHSYTDKEITMQVAPGLFEKFKLNDFRPKKGVQKLRMFRGGVETHRFPRNRPLELHQAKEDVRLLKYQLYSGGRMAKSDMRKIERFINPRVKTFKDMSEHELHVYTDYLGKLKKGEKLPDSIMSQVKLYGAAEADVRLGILATFRPARWMFEALNKKIPWMMDRYFHPTIDAVANRAHHQMTLMDRVRTLAGDFSRKDLRRIYEIDKLLAKHIRMAPGTPQYINIRDSMMDMQYRKLAGKIGQARADKLHDTHRGFRALFDEMFDQLVKAGFIKDKRYIKQYWPLLREESILTAMFGGRKGKHNVPQLPKQVEGFMQKVRKNVIENPETDILRLSQAYIGVFTKLMHLSPVVDDMYKIFSDFRIKKDVRDLMKHFMSRQLGLPSEFDYRAAATLKGMGEKLPFFKKGAFDGFSTRDWQRMGQFFNNLPYYAHMGMRPFAAARNLMQPFITTGPMIGNRWLVRGLQMMTKPSSWKYIKSIGGLQESLGEYTRRLHIRPKMRDKFANTLMWMFRKSDEMNRITSGMGMASKFDHYFKKHGMTEEFFTRVKLRRFRDSVRSRVRDKAKVSRALKELETHKYPKGSPAYNKVMKTVDEFSHGKKNIYLAGGSEAVEADIKETLVKEAIGDTQWLYGKDQSPLFGYRGGFMGRQAMTYQTWWLNYFEWMKNLGRLTKGGDYAPLATAFANNMLLLFALTSVVGWSWDKGLRTIAFGPFQGRVPFMEGEIPPGIDPFVKTMGAVRNVLVGDFEGAEQRLETAMKKAWDNWLPGSLVYKEMARIGVTPKVTLWGTRLTPKPKKRFAEPYEKVLSMFGAQ